MRASLVRLLTALSLSLAVVSSVQAQTSTDPDSTGGARRVSDEPATGWFRATYQWRLAGGTSLTHYNSTVVARTDGGSGSALPVIGGGTDGAYHFALSLSRAARGTAVDWRAELAYNRMGNTQRAQRVQDGQTYQLASRDEVLALTLNSVFRAARQRRVAPYLLVGAGAYVGQVGYDTGGSYDVDATKRGVAFGVNGGVGLEVSVARVGLFAEARRHQRLTGSPGGANFTPLTLGVRF